MLDQLLKELMAMKPSEGFTGLDWANTKAAEFDAQNAFEEHIREKGAELVALCREHGIPCLFSAIIAEDSKRSVYATLLGSGIQLGSDAHPLSRTGSQLMMAYSVLDAKNMKETIDRVAEIATCYKMKVKKGNQ
jgi:hypothetical protein